MSNPSIPGSRGRALGWASVSSKEQAEEDKSSIPGQIAAIRQWCEVEEYQLLETLVVPGQSRNFIDFHDLNRNALKHGIDAFDKLMKHIKARDFDVLVVRDWERIGRTLPLISFIIYSVIETAGAKIYAYAPGGGWVDENSVDMYVPIAGFSANIHRKRVARGTAEGQKRRSQKGLPHSKPPISHQYVRDPITLKQTHLVVNESQRPLLNALRDILLAGTPFYKISEALDAYEKAHHISFNLPRKTRVTDYWRRFFLNCLVWGNTLDRNPRLAPSPISIYGKFSFSSAVTPPDGITVFYGTHPSAWTGEDAHLIQNNLLYNHEPKAGRGGHRDTRHRFSRLLVCDTCHHAYSFHTTDGKNPRYMCSWRHGSEARKALCSNSRHIHERTVQDFFDKFFQRLIESDDVNGLFRDFYGRRDDRLQEIVLLDNRLKKARDSIQMLIRKQMDIPEAAAAYDDQIRLTSSEIAGLQEQIKIEQRRMSVPVIPDLRPMVEKVKERLPTFWEQSDLEINSILMEILGGLKLAVHYGEIVGIIPDPRPPKGRPPRKA